MIVKARHTHESSPGAAKAGLIPDYLSDLFEDVRCEHVSFFEVQYAAPFRVRFPARDETCGYLIEKGAAILEAGGVRLELEAGDLAMTMQGHPHTIASRDECSPASIGHAIYRLDKARTAPLLKVLPPALVLKGRDGQMSRWVAPLAALIMQLRDDADAGSMAILRRIAEASIIRAAQEYLQGQATIESGLVSADFHRIAPVLRAMHRAPGADWTVASLAREAGMSRTIFATVFAETMGEAPGHYLTQLRMATARDLLCSENLTISAVATRVGYQTEAAFSRAFKRQIGVAPGSYRKGRA